MGCQHHNGLAQLKEYRGELLRMGLFMWKEQSFPQLFPYHSKQDSKKYPDMKNVNVCLLKYKDK